MASSLGTFAPFTVEHQPADENGHVVCTEKPLVKGLLDVEVHRARNLHNICIHANQDVYAKLTLRPAGVPELAFLTDVVNKGGKDPVFNQKFTTSLVQSDCVLRCEVWMASKMRDYLQDQLLGAVSIPLASLVGTGKQFNSYSLSSTELFHSPSGHLDMTLEFVEDDGRQSTTSHLTRSQSGQSYQSNNSYEFPACNSTTSNLSPSSESDHFCGIDSKGVEFRSLTDAREDEELVSDFIRRASKKPSLEDGAKDDGILTGPPFLALDPSVVEKTSKEGASQAEEQTDEHSEVTEKTSLLKVGGEAEVEKSSKSSLEQVGKQVEVMDKASKYGLKQLEVAVSTSSSQLESTVTNGLTTSTPTPSSKLKEAAEGSEKSKSEARISSEEEAAVKKVEVQLEPRILQEEIMDMYTKSMQQFSEALAKMQLPVDENGLIKLDESDTSSDKNKNKESSSESGERTSDTGNGTTTGKRVFYGSRAFF